MTRNEARRWRERIENAAKHLPDEEALESVELFPEWDANAAYAVGDRVQHDGMLYKIITAHTAQADWPPNATPALYAVVSIEDGSAEHPIPYSAGMELTEGLYYTEDGIAYICTRSTGIPVYNALAELVGLYVASVGGDE